jgi:hypothetical protein
MICLGLKSIFIDRLVFYPNKTKLLFLLYLIICVISSFWSIKPMETLFFSFLNIAIFINILKICSQPKVTFQTVFYLLFMITILEVIVMFERLYGTGLYTFFESFHGSGSIQSAVALVMWPLIPKNNKNRLIFCLFIIVLIISTSWKVNFAIIFIVLIELKKFYKFFFGIIILLILLIYSDQFFNLNFGKLEHLGGRLFPWLIMIEKIKSSLLIGYGFPFGDEIYVNKNFTILNAHNFILGTLLYTGLLGFLPITLFTRSLYLEARENIILKRIFILLFISFLFNIGLVGKISGTLFVSYLFIGIISSSLLKKIK